MFYYLHNIHVRPGIAPLTNEHIITRQAGDVPLLLMMSGQGCLADTVHYFNIYVMELSGI
jgi:hypothetical protein